jgi:nitrous-oxide reductase
MLKNRLILWIGGAAVVAVGIAAACQRPVKPGGLAADDASAKVYVAPGQKDELYMFASGGFSGNVAV